MQTRYLLDTAFLLLIIGFFQVRVLGYTDSYNVMAVSINNYNEALGEYFSFNQTVYADPLMNDTSSVYYKE